MGTVNPLEGVRVIDVTTFLAGPFATRVLAGLGAEVVKVEPPGGDPTRGGWTGDGDAPAYWQVMHRGRKSVVLDLRSDEGRDGFRRLVASADVLVENLRPGSLAGLGLAPESLREGNKRLITCSISGFASAEMVAAPAVDGVIQAWTGAVAMNETWTGVPLPIPVQIADLAGGTSAAHAVLGALVARGTSGAGCHVEVTLEAAVAQWLTASAPLPALAAMTTVATGSDGGRFLVQAPMHFGVRLRELTGDGDDPWSTATAAEWVERIRAAGIPVAPLGDMPAPPTTPPWTYDGAANDTMAPPPGLGEHNTELLT